MHWVMVIQDFCAYSFHMTQTVLSKMAGATGVLLAGLTGSTPRGHKESNTRKDSKSEAPENLP